jgi:hypothetical protein
MSALIDRVMADLGLQAGDKAKTLRKLSSIMTAGQRVAGRALIPGEWREKHGPIGGRIWVRNPPISDLYTSSLTIEDAEYGCIAVPEDVPVTVDYAGGLDMPDDVYGAVLALIAGGDINPGVVEEQIYDLGTVKFRESADPILGHYRGVFEHYRTVGAVLGTSTVLSSGVL